MITGSIPTPKESHYEARDNSKRFEKTVKAEAKEDYRLSRGQYSLVASDPFFRRRLVAEFLCYS